ncbi:MAG: hypothetical protein OXG92_03705 [Chloroflexi bacterium]|nr:hypothetical protein [Chloroflexota bacterium]MCY3583094.1 hypothetical protein [Chloroflexota bacterium]MCY3715560.1 hypothetical protein [Chloroflexota bacterium]MDE2650702.1 hypothetical protein [Chloroflexota bacterium]MXV92585.1 hypothetical protein [Chloroflexota bacterium]
MTALRLRRHFILAMAKQLPPSSTTLRLLDLDGGSAAILCEARAGLQPLPRQACQPDSLDAIVGYDVALTRAMLGDALNLLRSGGRLIVVQPRGSVSRQLGEFLVECGYARILVEPALDELGVLIRGEKPHNVADPLARIQSVARHDADSLELARFRGRYLHLLIQQQPNIPAWKRSAQDAITWRAAAIQALPEPMLLAFSSLPKAVGFMQPAVLDGLIRDVNKVGKFSRETAQTWPLGLRINPTVESLRGEELVYIDIDPASAEAPDE